MDGRICPAKNSLITSIRNLPKYSYSKECNRRPTSKSSGTAVLLLGPEGRAAVEQQTSRVLPPAVPSSRSRRAPVRAPCTAKSPNPSPPRAAGRAHRKPVPFSCSPRHATAVARRSQNGSAARAVSSPRPPVHHPLDCCAPVRSLCCALVSSDAAADGVRRRGSGCRAPAGRRWFPSRPQPAGGRGSDRDRLFPPRRGPPEALAASRRRETGGRRGGWRRPPASQARRGSLGGRRRWGAPSRGR
jgi:hypothetical protein